MCRKRVREQNGGFALMAALFIIVTLAAIGTYLLTVSTGQVAAAAQDEQGARAYQAARAGIEWGAYQVLISSSCAASQTIQLEPGGGALNGFWVQVQCAASAPETDGATPVTVYRITATGCNRNACGAANTDAYYVERQLQLTLSK